MKQRTSRSKNQSTGKDVPRKRKLKTAKSTENSCLFCKKSDHNSANSFKAKNMLLAERQEVVKKKDACFNCLRLGHGKRFC